MSGTPEGVRIDTTLSLLIPYAAFLAGDKLGVSGVLAVVAAGLCGGVLDHRHLRATTRLNGVALWSMVTLVLNGAVFVMLGLEMPQVLQRVEGYSRWHLLGYVALLTLAVFAVRLVWTLLLAWWSRRRQSDAGEGLPNFGLVMVAVLCGVRGSLALSATLSIPLFTAAGADAARARSGRLPGGGDDRCDALAQWRGDGVSEAQPDGRREEVPDGARRPCGDRAGGAEGLRGRPGCRRLQDRARMGHDVEAPVREPGGRHAIAEQRELPASKRPRGATNAVDERAVGAAAQAGSTAEGRRAGARRHAGDRGRTRPRRDHAGSTRLATP